MKRIIAILMIFLLPMYTFSTCVVVSINNHYLFIGADSFQSKSFDGGYKTNKINILERYCFAISGIYYDSKTKYNPTGIIKDFLNRCDSFDETAQKKLDIVLNNAILSEIKTIRNNPKMIAFTGFKNISFLEYAIIGFRNGFPYVYVNKIIVKDIYKKELSVHPANYYKTSLTLVFGQHKAADDYIINNRVEYEHSRQLDLIKKLIRLEIVDQPASVDYPIHIVGAYHNIFSIVQ